LTLGVVLLAAHRKDIVGSYKHPKWLTIFGILIVIAASYAGVKTLSNMALLLQ
jgi:Mn2+/Fe2+ NRAMP family transporter